MKKSKKSKNQRKKEFLQRIKKDEVIENTDEKKDRVEDKKPKQEAPSIIAQRILMRRLRGHIGKKDDEELER